MASKKVFNSDSEYEESGGEEESILFPRKKKQDKVLEEDSGEEDKLLADSDDDDSGDDAPEDIGFADSRQTTLDHVKKTLAQIQGVRKEQKVKLKQKHETYKQQKLEALNKNRLPEDFLDELTDEVSPPKKSKVENAAQNPVDELQATSDVDSGSNDSASGDDAYLDDEFIPLDKSQCGIEAVDISAYLKEKPQSALEKAKEFRGKLLYGGTVPRETSKEVQNRAAKRVARYK